jgi:pimeloyl-ACP methyl ester carboxylesterase
MPSSQPLRRTLQLTAVVMLFGILAGATYQGVATALERREFPHPGRLVDIGGHQLHIHCTGDDAPTVILEAPAASMSAAWGLIQPRIAETARVCSYDRAGLGWSEAGDKPFDPSRVPDDLKVLLERAGEDGPFVIAGQGLGAAYARTFAARYADRTAAVVLIDAPTSANVLNDGPLTRVTRLTPWLARTGVLRALRTGALASRGLPEQSGGATRAFLYRPDHLSRAATESSRARETVRMADEAEPAAPLINISVGGTRTGAVAGDAETAARIAAAIDAAVVRVRRARS